jgi:uncharacterized membrane protein
MQLLGIPLRKPGFNELTAAVVMGTGLWVLAVGVAHWLQLGLGRAEAGALLVVMLWGAVSARLGIRVGQGRQHLLANLAVSALLLAIYQGAWAMAR